MISKRILVLLTAACLSSPAVFAEQQPMSKQSKAKQSQTQSQSQGAQKAQLVKIQDIKQNPDKWIGKTVKIQGLIEETAGNSVFKVNGAGIFNDELVVMRPTTGGREVASVTEGENIEVTGKLARMNVIDIERGYSLDLDPQLRVELEDSQLLFVADSVSKKQ